MRLTLEEHPEAIKRYAHLKRARGLRARTCYAALADSPRTCTRESGHRGPHAAHGRFARLLAVWDSGTRSGAAPSAPRRRAETGRAKTRSGPRNQAVGERRPMGIKSRDTTSLPGRALRGLLHFLKSPDEVAFVFLFLVFVYWGIQWMMMILR